MSLSILEMFAQARKVSTPIVAIETADPAVTVLELKEQVGDEIAQLQWDIMRGFSGVNKQGAEVVKNLQSDDFLIREPDSALRIAERIPEDAVMYMHGTEALWSGTALETAIYAQGIYNLRDAYKATGRTLVLLASVVQLPGRIESDVLVLDEPLPDAEQLLGIVVGSVQSYRAAIGNFPVPTEEQFNHAVDALRGLPAFAADQATVMSMTKGGLDGPAMWDRKREKIKQVPGLMVWDGEETYDTIGGCRNVKNYLRGLLNGPEPPRVIVFVDEIEKAMAGAQGGDLSGVSQEMHGTLLSWMEDTKAGGSIFIGPPGAAKSAVAKATGKEAGILTIVFDLSGMKGSLVGESNGNLRRALKVVNAVSDGQAMVIATCNGIGGLSPELRRRFVDGTFFFDLPDAEERAAIWNIYRSKYNVVGTVESDEGWTGAEIKQACRLAYRLRKSVSEAAQYVVPVSVSARETIDALRRSADDKFLSASYEGKYRYPGDVQN